MSFTYNLANSIGQVRLNLGDKVQDAGLLPGKVNFSDEELAYFLTKEGNSVMRAVAAACEMLATAWSAEKSSVTVGPASYAGQQAASFQARADKLRAQYGSGESAAATVDNAPFYNEHYDPFAEGGL